MSSKLIFRFKKKLDNIAKDILLLREQVEKLKKKGNNRPNHVNTNPNPINTNPVIKIKKFIKYCNNKYRNLPVIDYNNKKLDYYSLHSFIKSTKGKNDEYNKIRESVVGAIINDKIPEEYYQISPRWKQMHKLIFNYIKSLVKDVEINTIQCIHKGGRSFHYDFTIIINNIHQFNTEFKYNAFSINQTPQYCSPMKPSQYMTMNYEEYFYQQFLPKIAKEANLSIPSRDDYFTQIHDNNPPCMIRFKELYKNNEEFNKKCKSISKESIETFLEQPKLSFKKDTFTEYLVNTQKDKHYMMFYQNKFYYQTPNMDDYIIHSWIICPKNKNRFICQTKSGIKMKILLRWKNGNGIAFPAFQIS